ncbi:MAG: hypothetical protein RQ761_01145 [Bacteroidales bacterium]|nr:hypothetical protein [Bacteroidales bacterium]
MIRKAILAGLLLTLALSFIQAQDVYSLGPADTETIYPSDTRIFPCKWRKKKTAPAISGIHLQEISRTNQALEIALNKYPVTLLEKNLKKIYIVSTMRFFNLDYGGTYFRKNVYITNNGIENGYTQKYIEGTFHHEFSSILLIRHKKHFDVKAWHKANPEGFNYGKGGLEALKTENASVELDSSLFHMGFLSRYSLASVEEDFNCYAEYLFLSDHAFWKAWDEHEAIRAKTNIIIAFFSSLNPVFSFVYFKDI